jgi:hypothetical protein
MNIISQIFYWLYVIFFNLKQRLFAKQQVKTVEKKQISIDYAKKYEKYVNFYKSPGEDANINIDEDLFDYEKRKLLFKNANNAQEKAWRSRILIENTDRGNILMYYDCYRMSFAYHSDAQVIPYNILYNIAIKYVVIYRCRNFFIDMDLNPSNPMHNLLKAEDDVLKTKKSSKSQINNNSNVFAKPSKSLKQSSISNDKKTNNEPVKNKYTNKFSRISKLCEYNIAQKPPCKKIAYVNALMFGDKPLVTMADFFDELDIKETSTLFLSSQQETPPPQNSYAAFKAMKQL